MKLLIVDGIVLDFGDHNFIEEVDFPELLIVTDFLIVFGVDLIDEINTWISGVTLFHDYLIDDSLVLLVQDATNVIDLVHDLVFKIVKLLVYEVLFC